MFTNLGGNFFFRCSQFGFFLLFSSPVMADDISDFEIEGMSIGDSLLDYMSEEKIKTELEENRYMYEQEKGKSNNAREIQDCALVPG